MANLTTNLNYLQPTSYKITIDRENYLKEDERVLINKFINKIKSELESSKQ